MGDVVRRHRSRQARRVRSETASCRGPIGRANPSISTAFRFTRTSSEATSGEPGRSTSSPGTISSRSRSIPAGPASNEWASTSELRPLARLTIDPGDFPFLDQVGGHDDGELIAAEEIGDIVMSKVTRARAVPGGMVVSLTWDDEVAGVWDDYVATRQRFNPDVERTLTVESRRQGNNGGDGSGGIPSGI